jgi:YesN/AraC family two-component response regulator
MHRIKTVLVVDDDPLMRNVIHSMLKISHPCVVIVHASHGVHGWEIIKARTKDGKKFDLVISDVEMEKMDGVQLAEKIQKDHPEVHIILISGNKEPSNHKAHAFLAKPFVRGDLLETIKRLLGKI